MRAFVRFWTAPFVPNVLALLALLILAAAIVRLVPPLRRVGIPNAIFAGLLGLLLGPSVLDVLPVDTDVLEVIVYHAFAVVFIAVGLQSAPPTKATGSARSMAFGIAFLAVSQALLGFILVAAWMGLTQGTLHPGFSWMVTLGFMQGPGQALALGSAWEGQGLVHGGQIGLIFAALGFAYCIILGVPLVALARRRGWIEAEPCGDEPVDPPTMQSTPTATPTETPAATGPNEPLSVQIMLVAGVYIATFGLLFALTRALPEGSPLHATLWGFHFIVGSAFAIGLRRTAQRMHLDQPFNDPLLARITVIAVDITTAGAIAAVRLDVLTAWLGPILFMTTIAGLLTGLVCLWSAKRLFPDRPFAHSLVLLGTATGTISTGLALLRMVDPELRGPVARNVVVAATGSVPINAPLFIGVIPLAVTLWPGELTTALLVPAGVLVVYLAALLVGFAKLTPARLLRPITSLWPTS